MAHLPCLGISYTTLHDLSLNMTWCMISSLFQPKLHLFVNFLPMIYFNYVHFLRDKMQHIMTSNERSTRIYKRLGNTRKQGNPVVSHASGDSAEKKDTEK